MSLESPTENEPSPTYCAYPWVHIRTTPNSSASPCCTFEGDTAPISTGQSLQNILEGDFFSDLRSQMLAGKKLQGCRACYAREASGIESDRMICNKQFPAAHQTPPRIRSVEFTFGSNCNLKCRSCSSVASSKWIQDEVRLQRPVHLSSGNDLSLLDGSWKHLEKIKIMGGEPLLYTKQHEELLQRLSANIDLSRLSIMYSTNGTVRVSPSVLKVWSQLKELSLFFSVDGYGEKNDYFREGSHWEDWLATVQWFRDNVTGNVKWYFHTVVNIYNVHGLIEFDDWLLKQFPGCYRSKDFLSHPTWLDIRNLPDFAKRDLVDYFDTHLLRTDLTEVHRTYYRHIQDCLQAEPTDSFANFIREEGRLNKLWGYSLSDYFPRLADVIRKYELACP